MPSSRMLAEQFGISRTTVLLAYERLIADGLLETRPAQGTFVVPRPIAAPTLTLVSGGDDGDQPVADRKIWRPDPALFPLVRWRVLMRQALDHLGADSGLHHQTGEPALRKAVAAWMSSSRAVAVSPDQIIVADSRQQAMHIASHIILRPGNRVVVEDPCEEMTHATFDDARADIVRVPVDTDGLCTDKLPRDGATLVHVSPEHQRPLGAVLSMPRRHALLEWAKRTGTLVLEDDCQGELHYGSKRLPLLASLDQHDQVMLLGSFAGTLGPWVRMAYLAVPRRLAVGASIASRMIGCGSGRVEQAALAELMQGGCYARHVHRASKVYATRRDALVSALHRHIGESQMIWGDHAGLHLTWFPPSAAGPAAFIARMARLSGLEALALPDHQHKGGVGSRAVMLGFGTLSEQQIDQRVARLAAILPGQPVLAQSAD